MSRRVLEAVQGPDGVWSVPMPKEAFPREGVPLNFAARDETTGFRLSDELRADLLEQLRMYSQPIMTPRKPPTRWPFVTVT